MEPPRENPSEQGIALVLVLVVLVLTSILALEIKSTAALYSRLARNERDGFLMEVAMEGQLQVIDQVLLYDKKMNKTESANDIWNQDKYTQFQKGPSQDEQDSSLPQVDPVSSKDYQITAKIEDEARKFNLENLEIKDDAQRKIWEDIFLRLLDQYRLNNSQYAIARNDAEGLLDNLKQWIKRTKDENGIAIPATSTEGQVLVTPDELLMIPGTPNFTRQMFFDQKPDNEGDPVIPGLYRYLTLWSAGKINVNTAESPMIHALFTDQDQSLADALLEWRDQDADKQPDNAAPDAQPMKNVLTSLADLSKIDGFTADAIQRNHLAETITFAGDVFSVEMTGESQNGYRRERRWVIKRSDKGITTLLVEDRNDPHPKTQSEADQTSGNSTSNP